MMKFCYAIKSFSALLATVLGMSVFAAAPTVTAVTAQQRYPWNGLVDIVVSISGDESDVAKATCTFAATNSATQTGLAISHVTQVGTDSGSGTVWTRRFVWDTNADVGEVKVADVELVVEVEGVDSSGGVQLWEDGPYWAECNVGASKPEEYGSYFMWGSTVGHKPSGDSFSDKYFTRTNCPTYGKTFGELRSLGYIDSSGNLTASYDAATAHLGAPWRMPTDAEVSALCSNCDTEWATRNGVKGRLVKGRGAYASKSIFLPAAGYGHGSRLYGHGSSGNYWSSTPYSGNSYLALRLLFNSSYFYRDDYTRDYGHSVRPLRAFNVAGVPTAEYSVMESHLALDNRTGARVADTTEQIHFSPTWETDATRATAVVSANGVTVTNASETGIFEWTPAQEGTYQFAHTVFENGAHVGETLSATFVVNAKVTPQVDMQRPEYDVNTGYLTLFWECTNSTDDVRYDVYRRIEDFDPEKDIKIGADLITTTCVDTNYFRQTSQQPHMRLNYYVVAKRDGVEVARSEMLQTNNRYGLSFGINEFQVEDVGESCARWAEDLSGAAEEAKKFDELFGKTIWGSADHLCFTDGEATTAAIRGAFGDFAKKAIPGDVFVFYAATHGGVGSDGTGPAICMYEVDGLYLLKDLAADVDAFDKGVRVIGILDVCESGSMLTFDSLSTSAWLENTDLAKCKANVAWIGSSASSESANDGAFGEWFVNYGWEKHCAKSRIFNPKIADLASPYEEDNISFLRLAQYAKNFIAGSWLKEQNVQIVGNDNVLQTVAAFCKEGSVAYGEITTPVVVNATRTLYKDGTDWEEMEINLSWNAVPNATHYRIYRCGSVIDTVETNKWSDYVLDSIDGEDEYPAPEIGVEYTYSVEPFNPRGFGSVSQSAVGWMAFESPSESPIPELGASPSSIEVGQALWGSADDGLHENIAKGEDYNRFRSWAQKAKNAAGETVGLESVRNASYSWLSYALDSEVLIDKGPTNGQMRVETFESTKNSGAFDFTIGIDGVTIGSDAVTDNLKKVFWIEGGTTLDPGGFSSENVSITFRKPENGKVKFTAGPKNASEGMFFMKVKMTP